MSRGGLENQASFQPSVLANFIGKPQFSSFFLHIAIIIYTEWREREHEREREQEREIERGRERTQEGERTREGERTKSRCLERNKNGTLTKSTYYAAYKNT